MHLSYLIWNSDFVHFDPLWLSLQWAEIRTGHRQFLERIAPADSHPNPLPILMRAVNAVRLCHRIIFLPCWSSKRWRSRT